MKKRFPERVMIRAEGVRQAVKAGKHWSQIGGHKLHFSKEIVVFELPSWYRLVCWIRQGMLVRHELMSHERYNSFASNTRR